MLLVSLIGLAVFSLILVVPFGKGPGGLRIPFLLGFAAFLLVLALITAWILGITLFFPRGDLAQLVQDRHRLIQGHIDLLMMAQFLFIFAGLFRLYAIEPPRWVLALCCYGAFFNAFGLARAGFVAKPPLDPGAPPPEPSFPLPAAMSFTAVTLGFLAATFLILRAAWRLRRAARDTFSASRPVPAGGSGS
jgi:multisubunit Na+/H+ antiporter MnhC subunit